MEGCLELKYRDSLKWGMSVNVGGAPGNVSAFQSDKIAKWGYIDVGQSILKEIVKKELITSHKDYAKAVKSTA